MNGRWMYTVKGMTTRQRLVGSCFGEVSPTLLGSCSRRFELNDFSYGDNLQGGVAGFGYTPEEAMAEFDRNWTKRR